MFKNDERKIIMCNEDKSLVVLTKEEFERSCCGLKFWKACCHRQDHLLRLALEKLIIQNNTLCSFSYKYDDVWPLVRRIKKELRKDKL